VNEARQHGEARAIYASAEAFTNEFTRSIQARRVRRVQAPLPARLPAARARGRPVPRRAQDATQLELFHTICHLLDVGERDRAHGGPYAARLEGLDARLRSKLSSGSSPSSRRPDAIVRREILRQKAADGGVRCPTRVAS
jgi:chromosomal replication initiation ATPase DnaA